METAALPENGGDGTPGLKQRLLLLLRKFKELQGKPTYLARGAAIGVLIGFAPVMPLKSISIVALTVLSSSSTVAALLVCTFICNPFTYVPLYYMAWYVGNSLLPGLASWDILHSTMLQMMESSLLEALKLSVQIGFDTALVMLTGGVVIAVPLAILSYPLAYRCFLRLQKRETLSL